MVEKQDKLCVYCPPVPHPFHGKVMRVVAMKERMAKIEDLDGLWSAVVALDQIELMQKKTPWTKFEDEWPPEGEEILFVNASYAECHSWIGRRMGDEVLGEGSEAEATGPRDMSELTHWHLITKPEE